ncbi:MAG: trigger factor [Finegoldia sp.]|nr:trigger factor [Finegoldia sp.]
MSGELISKENNQAVFTVSIPKEDFEKAVEDSYNKNKKRFTVDGFRKGKVPRKILERKFGEGLFYEDAINALLPDAYEKALEELKLEPVAQPVIDIDEVDKNKDLEIKFTVDLLPEFELGDTKNLKASLREYKVSDEDVDMVINHELERNARIVDVDDRNTKDGDSVVLDFEGFVDGEAFEGGQAEDYELVIGSGTFIPGFEEQLVDKKIGEEFDVNVTFPENYHAENLAGKEATFKSKIKSIKEKILPELDDEFVKDVSEFDTLDEYKKDIREGLEKDSKNRELVDKQNKSVLALIDTTDFELPKSMIEAEVDAQFEDFSQRVRSMGIDLDQYFAITQSSEEAVRDQLRPNAETKIKGDLVIDKYTDVNKIEASDEEIDEELKELFKVYGDGDESEFVENFKNSPSVEYIKRDIKRRKALDKLVEEVNFEYEEEVKEESTKEDSEN